MNKEEKFLNYLEGLKTDGNAELLESISEGFKTLVEYRVNGSIEDRSVDIMESEDDMVDDPIAEDPESTSSRGYTVSDVENMSLEEILKWNGMTLESFNERVKDFNPVEVNEEIAYWVGEVEKQADDFDIVYGSDQLGDLDTPLDESTSVVKARIFGKNSDQARNAEYLEKQKEGVAAGIKAAGAKNKEAFAALNEEGEVDEEVMMEVGEGDVKGQLTPALLRAVDNSVEEKIREMASMIDRQKLVSNDEQKLKYLKHMRGQLWREELLNRGVNPAQAKGLMPAMNESVEEADTKLLDFIDSAFKLFQIAKPE